MGMPLGVVAELICISHGSYYIIIIIYEMLQSIHLLQLVLSYLFQRYSPVGSGESIVTFLAWGPYLL